MTQRPPQIVAFGGGGFSMEAGNPLLDDYVLGLTGAERPKAGEETRKVPGDLPQAMPPRGWKVVRVNRACRGGNGSRASHDNEDDVFALPKQ